MIATLMAGCAKKVSNVEIPVVTKTPPTVAPTQKPTETPTAAPTETPKDEPTATPTLAPDEAFTETDNYDEFEPYLGMESKMFNEVEMDWTLTDQTDKYNEKDLYEICKVWQYVLERYSVAIKENIPLEDTDKKIRKYYLNKDGKTFLESAKDVKEYLKTLFECYVLIEDAEYDEKNDCVNLKYRYCAMATEDEEWVWFYDINNKTEEWDTVVFVKTDDGWKIKN